ncbi:MAG TPA: hypothetical protein VH916_05205, partial [Dehalococcoidia bacterium]
MSNKLLAGLAGAVGVLVIGIIILAVAIVASSGGSSSNSKAASKQNTSAGTPGAGSSSNTNNAKAPSSNVKGGELRVPGDDPLTLDPALAFDTTSAEYIVEIYGGLVQLDKNLKVIPDIAKDLPTITNNGTTYTFHLRDDVVFQN